MASPTPGIGPWTGGHSATASDLLSVSGGRWHGGELVHPETYDETGLVQRARDRVEAAAAGGRVAGRTGGKHTVLPRTKVERGLM